MKYSSMKYEIRNKYSIYNLYKDTTGQEKYIQVWNGEKHKAIKIAHNII